MKNKSKNLAALAVLTIVSHASFAQDQVGNQIRTGLNNGWVWAQAILTFALILLTVIGIIVTYGKKNSEQPGEFKKYVIGFSGGVLFLIIALSIVSVLKAQIAGALNTSF